MSETQQQKCADLARARGWTVKKFKHRFGLCRPDGTFLQDPFGDSYPALFMSESDAWQYAPNPYKSAEDSRALVAWLATDDARWFVFIRKLIKLINWPSQSPQEITDATFPKIVSEVKHLMTAPLETIADAAWLVIQGK